MKKSFINCQIAAYFILFLGLILGCKKNDIRTNIENASSSSVNNQFKIIDMSLKQVAKSLIPLLGNMNGRSIIKDLANKKFDEEYEVLVKDIFKDNRCVSLLDNEICEKIHNNLKNNFGTGLYPQIYIPHLQFLEDNASSYSQLAQEEDPLFVFYSGDAEVDSSLASLILPGFKLIDNEFVYSRMVDENYADQNEVWVFSLNETVNSFGRLPCPFPDECGAGGGGTGGGGTGGSNDDLVDDDPDDAPGARIDFPDLGHNKVNFMIQYMRVRNGKESWAAGASEIAIKAKLVCHNGRDQGILGGEPKEYSSDQYSNRLGKLIKKVKRKDIKNIELLTVNYSLQTNWQNDFYSIDPVHFVYIMFERDIVPATLIRARRYAPVSSITFEEPPRSFKLFYRSSNKNGWDIPYADSRFTNTLLLATSEEYAGTGMVSNSDIAFNTVFY